MLPVINLPVINLPVINLPVINLPVINGKARTWRRVLVLGLECPVGEERLEDCPQTALVKEICHTTSICDLESKTQTVKIENKTMNKCFILFNDTLNTFCLPEVDVPPLSNVLKVNRWSGKEGRKEMFLFNDALNTFYGVRHMVKDHSDSVRGNPLLPHGLLFLISSKGSFICTIPRRTKHILFTVIWRRTYGKGPLR